MFWIKLIVTILCAVFLFNGIDILLNVIKNGYTIIKKHLLHVHRVKVSLIAMLIYGVAFVLLSVPLAGMLAGNLRLDPVTIGVEIFLAYDAAKLKLLI